MNILNVSANEKVRKRFDRNTSICPTNYRNENDRRVRRTRFTWQCQNDDPRGKTQTGWRESSEVSQTQEGQGGKQETEERN